MKTACALCRVQTCFDRLFLISYFKMYQILSESNNCRKSFAICQIKILSVSFHLRLSLFVITTVNVNICFHKSKQKKENISQAAIQTQNNRHHELNRDTSRKKIPKHCTMPPPAFAMPVKDRRGLGTGCAPSSARMAHIPAGDRLDPRQGRNGMKTLPHFHENKSGIFGAKGCLCNFAVVLQICTSFHQ